MRQVLFKLSYRTGRGDMVTDLLAQCPKSSSAHEQI